MRRPCTGALAPAPPCADDGALDQSHNTASLFNNGTRRTNLTPTTCSESTRTLLVPLPPPCSTAAQTNTVDHHRLPPPHHLCFCCWTLGACTHLPFSGFPIFPEPLVVNPFRFSTVETVEGTPARRAPEEACPRSKSRAAVARQESAHCPERERAARKSNLVGVTCCPDTTPARPSTMGATAQTDTGAARARTGSAGLLSTIQGVREHS